MLRSTLAPITPAPAVKKPFVGSHDSCGVTVKTVSFPTAYVATHLASTFAWRFSAERLYCVPGHSVIGCVILSVRPTTADLNCAIVPFPVGSFSLSTVMTGSLSLIDQSRTWLPFMAKLGFNTMFWGSAHAASIWSCVAGSPARRKRDSRSVGTKAVAVGETSESVLEGATVTVWISMSVVVASWTEVTVTTMGAVGQISGVLVLFRYAVGPADGIDEFPVG